MSRDLQRELESMYGQLRTATRERWERDLPFEDLLDDRWQRAETLGFGRDSSIYGSSYVFGDVSVGTKTWIGPLVLLDGTGRLTIGAGCDISAGVQIYTHDTVHRVLSEGVSEINYAPVTIEDFVHLGAGSIVLKGVTIGHHSVIGARSLVLADVAPYSVAVGAPCRSIGRVKVDSHGSVRLEYHDRG